MSNIIHTELEDSYQSLLKKRYNSDINNDATSHQIELIQKIISLNMNDIEFSAFFYNYIISFKSNYFYTKYKQGSIVELQTFKYYSDFIEVISVPINRLAGKSTKTLTPYKIIDNNRELFQNELNIYIFKQIELYNKNIKKSVKRMTSSIKNEIEPNITSPIASISVEIPNAPKKPGNIKLIKDEIEPKKLIFTDENKKKELTPYNIFYKEQIIALKDNNDIPNKMTYIAKLWNNYKQSNDIPYAPKKQQNMKNINRDEGIEPKILFNEDNSFQNEILKKNKKLAISATVKKLVWNVNIGEEFGKSKCLCCKVTDITQMSFHCGHIIAESQGGETIVSNLRPICQNCNSSMGSKNMDDFIKTLK